MNIKYKNIRWQVLIMIVIVISLICTNDALAIVEAHDKWFGSEKEWIEVNQQGDFVLLAVRRQPLKFLYKHWGDGAPQPVDFSDALIGKGRKPEWLGPRWNKGKNDRIYNSIMTRHAKGSMSKSEWELVFESRYIPLTSVTNPHISGNITAIADAKNFKWATEAHTKTKWEDPFLFFLPSNVAGSITIYHRFMEDKTFAQWISPSPVLAGTSTGQGGVFRCFSVQETDQHGICGSEKILQFVQIGTTLNLIDLNIGSDVTFLDGSSLTEKKQQIENNLNPSLYKWSLTSGNTLLLDFRYDLPAVEYDRMISLNLSGGAFAAEANTPEPTTVLLFGIGLAGIWGRIRIRSNLNSA